MRASHVNSGEHSKKLCDLISLLNSEEVSMVLYFLIFFHFRRLVLPKSVLGGDHFPTAGSGTLAWRKQQRRNKEKHSHFQHVADRLS